MSNPIQFFLALPYKFMIIRSHSIN